MPQFILHVLLAFAILALTHAQTPTSTSPCSGCSNVLNCYNCMAWQGSPSHTESCRANGVNSRTCTAVNTMLFDPVTGTVLNKTVADLALEDPSVRAKGDWFCFKEASNDNANNNAVVIRGCAQALQNGNYDGVCETSKTQEIWESGTWTGVLKAGAVTRFSATNNGNSGSASGACGSATLRCYNCVAWEGTSAHNEACRDNGQNPQVCTAKNTMVIDPVTWAVTNKTVSDLALDDPLRSIGDWLCFKQAGRDTNNKAVVMRGCAVAPNNEDYSNYCGTSAQDEVWPGMGTLRAGFAMWVTTANLGNGGYTPCTCSGNPSYCSGGSVTVISVSASVFGVILGATIAAAAFH